jgi:hypothetical protein
MKHVIATSLPTSHAVPVHTIIGLVPTVGATVSSNKYAYTESVPTTCPTPHRLNGLASQYQYRLNAPPDAAYTGFALKNWPAYLYVCATCSGPPK